MTSGANQGNSAEKNRSKQLRKSAKRPSSSTEGTSAKQLRKGSEERMDDEGAGSSMTEHNLVSNFNKLQQENARASGSERLKKKLTIKNYRSRGGTNGRTESEAPDIDNEETSLGRDWLILRDNVDAILEDRKTTTTLETLFTIVQSVCDKNESKPLYKRLIGIIANYATTLKSSLKAHESFALIEDNCEQYLAKFGKIWEAFPVKINLIRNIFLYLDRMSLSGAESDMIPLWDISMQIYQKTFFPDLHGDFKTIKLFAALYMAMNKMMQKFTVDSPLRTLVDMLQTVRAGNKFSEYLISQIRQHYTKERLSKVPAMSCNEYMAYAEDQINRYTQIVKVNFDEQTALKDVQSTVLNCLVQEAIPQILTHDFDKLLDSGDIKDIRRMFELCRKCNGGEDEIRTQFSKYMKDRGDKIVSTYPEDMLVTELLSFKQKINAIISGAFNETSDHVKMRQCISDAFEVFVNKDGERMADLISKHFHSLLHSGNKIITDDTTLDQMVDDAIVLFRYLQGKDVFEAYYKRGLSKRLFLERSASVDAEKMVLCKLKTECGAAFTYKLEGMFRDMDASENYQMLFNQYLDHANKEKTNFSARVITGEFWPPYNPYEINIPKEMRVTLDDFEEFYRSQHQNRHVKWYHALGVAVLSGKFRPGVKKELVMTMHQAVIMLLFNKCETWTVDEIVECTKIEQMEVVKNVLALMGGRDKPSILMRMEDDSGKKESTVDSVKTDKIVVNSSFTDRRFRIRVAQVNIKSKKEEKEDIDNEVSQDRQYHVDACIVRIMKAHKLMHHTALMKEILHQIKFPMKVPDIKLRLESLIEREYISREPDDATMIKYVS